MQKSEFLKALSDMWKDFDTRVLRYKVIVFVIYSYYLLFNFLVGLYIYIFEVICSV